MSEVRLIRRHARRGEGATRRAPGPGSVMLCICLPLLWAAGCGLAQIRPINELGLREQALRGLKAGSRYQQSALVRAQAIEALGEVAGEEGIIYFLEAVRDPSPAVRFAACMALGTIEHEEARELLRLRLEDGDGSVQVAAVYALHRMGDQTHTSLLADKLLRDPEVEVRRNAALVLGELGEGGSIRLLRHAARDKDESVRLQATEAMAALGDGKARQQLAAGIGKLARAVTSWRSRPTTGRVIGRYWP